MKTKKYIEENLIKYYFASDEAGIKDLTLEELYMLKKTIKKDIKRITKEE